MATVTRPGVDRESGLRPELDRLLGRLRSRIRRYVALEGTALVLALLAGLFWLSLLLDRGYYELTNLELPVAVRAGLLVAAGAIAAGAFVTYLVVRLARRLRARALALVLERRFPELNDRLVLAVENAERLSPESRGPVTEALIARAIDDVTAAADRLDVAEVFDRRPLTRALGAAAVLLLSIGIFAAVQPKAFGIWWDAYGRLAETYYPRETLLRLTVLAPPDDRPRTLEPGEVYKHPRGANLTLRVDVPEGERPDGRPWTVPDAIYARRRTDAGGRQTLPAVRTAGRQFRLTFEEVRDGMDLWLTGGDFTNRSPFRIEVVDSPRVERVTLESFYPGYTGLNARDEAGRPAADVRVLSGPVAEVPNGTLVTFRARSNKPIRRATVRLGEQDLAFGESDSRGDAGRLVTPGVDGGPGERVALPPAFAAGLVSDDRHEIVIPLLVTPERKGFLADGPADRPDLPRRPAIAVSAETPIRVSFEDADGVVSLEPSRFDLRGKADEPPKVETRLKGVSGIITRTAVVPLRGTIRDDHGITAARFEFKVDEAEEWSSRDFARPPSGRPEEFTLRREEGADVEWLDTATLDLKLGQKLTLAVAAEDADDLTGPHLTRGEAFVFTIVTSEELLTALYNQELNLRKRFEQSLAEMKAVREDLAAHRGRAEEVRAGTAEPQAADAIRSSADRSLAETQQNAGEVRAVSESFGEILEQLVNNRVHTENQLDRIRVGILDPLRRLTDERFPTLDRAVGELRVAIADGNDPRPGFDASLAAAETLIAEMESALKEMQDLAEFHEAIQELNTIFKDEQGLLDRTKDEQKRSVIDSLGDLLE